MRLSFKQRNKGRSFRERPFLLTAMAVVLTLSVAATPFLLGKLWTQQGAISRFELEATSIPVAKAIETKGFGLTVKPSASSNLIANPNFLPEYHSLQFSVAEADSHSISLPLSALLDEEGYVALEQGHLENARLQVLRNDQQQFQLLGESSVQEIERLRLRLDSTQVLLPISKHQLGAELLAATRYNAKKQESERIIQAHQTWWRQGRSSTLEPLSSSSFLKTLHPIALAASDEAFLLLAEEGLYRSLDFGDSWQRYELSEQPRQFQARSLCSDGQSFYLAGDGGYFAKLEGQETQWHRLERGVRIEEIVAYQGDLLMRDERQQLWGGSLMRVQELRYRGKGEYWAQTGWRNLAVGPDGVYAVNRFGRVLFGETSQALQSISPQMSLSSPIHKLLAPGLKQVFLLGEGGEVYQLDTVKQTWQERFSAHTGVRDCVLNGRDRLLVLRQGTLDFYSLHVNFFYQEEKEWSVRPGDKAFLSQAVYPYESEGKPAQVIVGKTEEVVLPKGRYVHWTLGGRGGKQLAIRKEEGELRLFAQDHHLRLLPSLEAAQKPVLTIPLSSEQLRPKTLYRLSFWAKREDARTLELTVKWQLGPSEIEEAIEGLTQEWKRFDHFFLLPSFGDEAVQLSFALKGTSGLDLAGLELVDEQVALKQVQEKKESAPVSFLRYEQLGIGSRYFSDQAWLLPPQQRQERRNEKGERLFQQGLEEALQESRSRKAKIWIKLGPLTTERSFQDVLSYLAAPVSEPMGKLRLENGSASPWTSILEQFYFEIGEGELAAKLYGSNQEKHDYLQMFIEALQTSPYYPQLKHKVFLVDAFNYQGEVKGTLGDYESDGMRPRTSQQADATVTVDDLIRETKSAYELLEASVPRKLNQNALESERFLHHLELSKSQVQSADRLLYQSLYAYGKPYSLLFYDEVALDWMNRDQQDYLLQLPLQSLTLQKQALQDGLAFYSYRKGSRSLVLVLNLSGEDKGFVLDSKQRELAYHYQRLDSFFNIRESRMSNLSGTFHLLPGEVALFESEQLTP